MKYSKAIPFFKQILKIYYLFNQNSKRIKGTNNVLYYSGAVLKRVSIEILGDNNQMILKDNVRISNTRIFIRGSGHKLIIEEGSSIGTGELIFNDENCLISIESLTNIQGVHIAVT